MEYLVLAVVAVVSFVAGRLSQKKFTPQQAEVLDEAREDAKQALSSRTEERKEKILKLISDTVDTQRDLEECSGIVGEVGIMRVDVEELLGVSSTTARRYLNELETEGTITQVGSGGRNVHYTLK